MANDSSAKANKPRSGLNSGLDVFENLVSKRFATLTEIARDLSMSKSGVHSLLAILVDRGYAERTSEGAYRLGCRAYRLSGVAHGLPAALSSGSMKATPSGQASRGPGLATRRSRFAIPQSQGQRRTGQIRVSDRAIVIGAGVIGAAVADALTASGVEVLIIDASTPGSGVTSAGMGHVVVMDDSPAQLELTSWSLALLDQISPALPPSCELNRCGTLWIAEDAGQLAAAHVKAARYTAAGISAEVIDSHTLASVEPHLRAGLAGAVHVPGDSVIRPPALCAFLLERATGWGARLLAHTPVLRLEPNCVITGSGRYTADIIVNAAGIDAARLSPELPILPRRGHLVMVDAHGELCRHQLVEIGYMRSAHDLGSSSVAFNVQPRRGGRAVIGSSRELSVGERAVEPAIVQRMLDRAIGFMPRIAQLPQISTWAGQRPATADGLPLIGGWEEQPGVWIAAGHEGLGTTTALATANLLTDLIHERLPAIDAAPFAPHRASAMFDDAVRAQPSTDVLATSNRVK